eukprot:TRINITY_DN45291_c0_g1_i1.p1 TRINITY_DN45291_c0_g1~~TRINITY_DN45291_c0_g1_i1.p1  ORF type:complete len:427 (+),score=61.31 TRINITY_DN45291_c0_g1_i1:83-1363(+)
MPGPASPPRSTLPRVVVIYLEGENPIAEFTKLDGGQGQPVTVGKMTPDCKARREGVAEGFSLVEMNGRSEFLHLPAWQVRLLLEAPITLAFERPTQQVSSAMAAGAASKTTEIRLKFSPRRQMALGVPPLYPLRGMVAEEVVFMQNSPRAEHEPFSAAAAPRYCSPSKPTFQAAITASLMEELRRDAQQHMSRLTPTSPPPQFRDPGAEVPEGPPQRRGRPTGGLCTTGIGPYCFTFVGCAVDPCFAEGESPDAGYSPAASSRAGVVPPPDVARYTWTAQPDEELPPPPWVPLGPEGTELGSSKVPLGSLRPPVPLLPTQPGPQQPPPVTRRQVEIQYDDPGCFPDVTFGCFPLAEEESLEEPRPVRPPSLRLPMPEAGPSPRWSTFNTEEVVASSPRASFASAGHAADSAAGIAPISKAAFQWSI